MSLLGKRMSILRKDKKLTQTELAEKIGLTKARISDYEGNRSKPSLETIVKISEYFSVTTDFLLKGIEESIEPEKPVIAAPVSVVNEEPVTYDESPTRHLYREIAYLRTLVKEQQQTINKLIEKVTSK